MATAMEVVLVLVGVAILALLSVLLHRLPRPRSVHAGAGTRLDSAAGNRDTERPVAQGEAKALSGAPPKAASATVELGAEATGARHPVAGASLALTATQPVSTERAPAGRARGGRPAAMLAGGQSEQQGSGGSATVTLDPPPVTIAGPRRPAEESGDDPGAADTRRQALAEAARIREAAEVEAAEVRTRAEVEAAEVRTRAEEELVDLRQRAAEEADQLRDQRRRAEEQIQALRAEVRSQRADVERREQRVVEREQRLDADSRQLAARSAELAEVSADLERRTAALADLEAQRRQVLEQVAGLSAEDAKAELVAAIENDAKRQAAILVRDLEHQAQDEAEQRARKIITTAVQRLATEQTAESVVSVLHLPSDDMKGRIIGREGRNIRTFEQLTGVNLIIDDTPEAVLLSCFDPVRRETARLALEALVLDGRIHPHRIEEVYERTCGQVEELCVRAGEDAVVDVGLTDVHPELVRLLGTLRYRTSYGQNVLKHLVECAHVAGLMASEIGLDPTVAKRCALLHDVGKALTHEVEGSHALVGADAARRFGEDEDVVHAIEAHHNEVEPRTVEAVLTQAADAISGGRPGARRESLEGYVRRLEQLEEIARGHEGVDKVFAMQAGREVRVMVLPDVVDDIHAQVLARDIAKQVEEELTYPGQIKVTVIRESRAVETAR